MIQETEWDLFFYDRTSEDYLDKDYFLWKTKITFLILWPEKIFFKGKIKTFNLIMAYHVSVKLFSAGAILF